MDANGFAALSAEADRSTDLRSLFAIEPSRAAEMTRTACGIVGDFSRCHVSVALAAAIAEHARATGIPDRFAGMAAGETVNPTEDRPALHVAARTRPAFSFESREAAARMAGVLALAESVADGGTVGSSGRRFSSLLHIGIGGSELGPAMVVAGLRRHRNDLDIRFVSNIDAADFEEATSGLDPASTLVVVASKTFSTLETMHNAARARAWISSAGLDWTAHVVAVTADPGAAEAWGVRADRCLVFADGVGGRFSVSSAVGFPVACAIGAAGFSEFLSGMADMDAHVASSPVSSLPFLHATAWFAHHVLEGRESVAVVAYSHDLARLPAFLQQLVMESNGKSTTLGGSPVTWPTSPVVWGGTGTNGQHAYFQFLHQGTHVTPVEFVGVLDPTGDDEVAHDLLLANLVAQAEALASGRGLAEVLASGVAATDAAHRVLPGNRPNSVLLLESLSPRTLGALVAMYEHSTVFQGWLCDVNSFDQFGVELGKTIASRVADAIRDDGSGTPSGDTMTHPLVELLVSRRRRRTEGASE